MQLELGDKEVEALRQALVQTLGELSDDIADTDNATFRRGPSDDRETLCAIPSRL